MFSRLQVFYKKHRFAFWFDIIAIQVLVILTLVFVTTTAFALPDVQETATYIPTPTNITTPIVPPTYVVVEPTIACNPGGINNWGSVTPDASWLFLCADCITPFTETPAPTLAPTNNPMTQTAIALTGTPTPTSIPSATPTQQTLTITSGNPNFQWTGSPYITGSHSGSCSGNPDGSVTCSGTVTFGDNSPNFPSNFTLTTAFEIADVFNTPITLYYSASDDMQVWGFNADDKFFWPASWGSEVWSSQSGSVVKPSMPSPYDTFTVQFARYSGAAEIFTGTYPYEFTVSPVPIDTGPTPTPVSTPVDSVCSQVMTPEDMNNISPFGLGGGNLITGQACLTIPQVGIDITPVLSLLPDWFYDAFNIEIPTLALGFPRTLVCIRTTNYTIKLFYVTISTDVLIGIILFLAIIRLGLPEMGNNV